jgi:hypothetical protein
LAFQKKSWFKPLKMKNLIPLIALLFAMPAFSQTPAEQALLLTGKSRYHADVLAFYKQVPMDTSSTFIHYAKSDQGLSIAFNPLDGYKTVFQVGLSKDFKGAFPLGLKMLQSEPQVAAITGPNLVTSPAYLGNEKHFVVVKGGLTIVLKFTDGSLSGLFSLYATQPLGSLNTWRNAPYAKFQEGCISGDCKESPSVYATKDKDVHIGKYAAGAPQGYGYSYLSDGTYFHGTYEKGVRKQGVYFFPSGNYFSGTYDEKGNPAQGTLTFKDRNIFSGALKNGKPYNGKMTYPSGNTFEGTFRDNGNYLQGTLFIAGRGTFKGTFNQEGKPDTGTYTSTSGAASRITGGVKQ